MVHGSVLCAVRFLRSLPVNDTVAFILLSLLLSRCAATHCLLCLLPRSFHTEPVPFLILTYLFWMVMVWDAWIDLVGTAVPLR